MYACNKLRSENGGIFMYWFLIIISVFVLLVSIAGIIFSIFIIHPKMMSVEETYNKEMKEGNLIKEKYDSLNKEEISIISPYGYSLYGLFFPVENSKKTIIICHGGTYTLYGSIKYMNLFLKRGFNVLIYDSRHHGRSGGRNITYGYYEKYVLKACVDWVFERCSSTCTVGMLGESFGAAIALQTAVIDTRVSFLIADSSFSDMTLLLKCILGFLCKLPNIPLLIPVSNFFTWLRSGMSYKNVSPIKDIKDIKAPIFFIHGEKDSFVPKEMCIEMYNKKDGYKKLYIAPNSGHAEAYENNPEEYEKLIGEFLEETCSPLGW
jgi:fermentation-respiration switch protein FrsA (DUF1100 family)